MAKATQKPRLVSRKEAAAELGFSRQRLETLIKQGRVHETAEGIDIDRAKQELVSTLDPVRRQLYEETFGKAKPKAKAEPRRKPYNVKRGAQRVRAAGSDDKQGELKLVSLNEAKVLRETALAKTAELKLGQMMSTLMPRDEVKAKEFAVARMVRDRIIAFPTRLANVIPRQAMKHLDDECKRLVRELWEEAAKIAETSPQP